MINQLYNGGLFIIKLSKKYDLESFIIYLYKYYIPKYIIFISNLRVYIKK